MKFHMRKKEKAPADLLQHGFSLKGSSAWKNTVPVFQITKLLHMIGWFNCRYKDEHFMLCSCELGGDCIRQP